MRQLITLILILTLSQLTYAQIGLKYFTIDNSNFLTIELDNLVISLNEEIDNWKNEIKENEFRPIDDSKEKPVYISGKMGSIFQLVSKDKEQEVFTVQWYNFENKECIMEKIENELKNNFINKKDELSYYIVKHKNINYIIGLKRNPELGMEEISITKQK